MPRPPSRAELAAGWIAEALSTGNPLAPLPPDLAPRDRAEGEQVALRALAQLEITPCGLRTLDGISGPMIEGRLLPDGANAAGLRHARATAALIGVLAEPMAAGGDAAPVFSAVHPALDLGDSRFTTPPANRAGRAADLAGLGFVVAGPPAPPPPDGVMVETGGGAVRTDIALAFAPVAAAARRLGGLPAGALLVAAGLSPLIAPDAEGMVVARFGTLGAVSARLG